jgi:hypothetical protein
MRIAMDSVRQSRPLRWLAALLACLSFVLVFSCNSPFIPIPPPNPTFTEGDTAGDWAVSAPADPRASGARYYIYNADLGTGIIQQTAADGSVYAYPLHGAAGDRITIHWERTSSDGSSTICRRLGEGLVVRGCD